MIQEVNHMSIEESLRDFIILVYYKRKIYVVKRRKVSFFSPNISEPELYHFYPKSVKLYHDWNNLIEELTKVHGDAPKAALFPCSIQLAEK